MKTLLGLTLVLALAAALLALDVSGHLIPLTATDPAAELLMVVASARG